MTKRRYTWDDIVYMVVYNFVIVFIAVITLYPIIFVVSASISDPIEVGKGTVILLPKGINFTSYIHLIGTEDVWVGYRNTLIYTVGGVITSMFCTVTTAYSLSKKHLVGGRFFVFMIAFTMWFSGGLIPTYLVIRDLGLIDSMWSQILPGLISPFYFVLMKTYFSSIPQEMEESAKMDGANDIVVLVKLYLPLSIPSLVTIGLYYAVIKWNAWFHAMIYLNDSSKHPLQLFLRQILILSRMTEETDMVLKSSNDISPETLQYATIVIAILPMMIVYPFIQKYFEKGVMVGSIKG